MRILRIIVTAALTAGLLWSCGSSKKASGAASDYLAKAAESTFPSIRQEGKVAIVAHRGFWKCNAGGMSENSIASLKAAQNAGFWGSECDVHLTADGIVMVNHNPGIEGMNIRDHKFADFEKCLLPNGERRPSFDEYLDVAQKCPGTVLIVELKKQKGTSDMTSEDRENALVDKVLSAIRAHGMYSPDRVAFISFSYHMCERIAGMAPEFINQFLLGGTEAPVEPEQCAKSGINGIDYHDSRFVSHPDWIQRAKDLGMSTNVWTVDKAVDMKYQIGAGVHAITTNEPLMLRDILGNKEFKNK